MARKPKQDSLKPNANPEDVSACFAEYSDLRGQAARIGQKISTMLGRYEKTGVDTKAIKHAYAAAQKDPNAVAAQERKNAEYLRMLDIIEIEPDGQASMLPGLTIVKPTGKAAEGLMVARAHTDGYNSGLHGAKVEACPTEKFGGPGSEGFVAWRNGWQDGHDDRVARKPEDATVVKASTRRKRDGGEETN
jgi:ribosome modulation factor